MAVTSAEHIIAGLILICKYAAFWVPASSQAKSALLQATTMQHQLWHGCNREEGRLAFYLCELQNPHVE